jgi:hypothetical protein
VATSHQALVNRANLGTNVLRDPNKEDTGYSSGYTEQQENPLSAHAIASKRFGQKKSSTPNNPTRYYGEL